MARDPYSQQCTLRETIIFWTLTIHITTVLITISIKLQQQNNTIPLEIQTIFIIFCSHITQMIICNPKSIITNIYHYQSIQRIWTKYLNSNCKPLPFQGLILKLRWQLVDISINVITGVEGAITNYKLHNSRINKLEKRKDTTRMVYRYRLPIIQKNLTTALCSNYQCISALMSMCFQTFRTHSRNLT